MGWVDTVKTIASENNKSFITYYIETHRVSTGDKWLESCFGVWEKPQKFHVKNAQDAFH